jgi:cbb3-type cytochrome oxidase subunit 3
MMDNLHRALPLLLSLALLSCRNESPREQVEAMIASANNVSEELVLQLDPDFYKGRSKLVMRGEAGGAQPPTKSERHIIRTGEYRFLVDDLDTARSRVHAMLHATEGFVQGEEENDWGDRLALVMRVRIPADKFNPGVQAIRSLGKLEHQLVQSSDVTSEWLDVEARLSAKRTLEQRYLDLVKQSNKVPELLEVERELGKVRADIESMEARMRGLGDQVAMSTLTITCITPKSSSWQFGEQVGASFSKGWELFLQFIAAVLVLWPFAMVLLAVLWWLRIRRRRIAARSRSSGGA